MAPIDNNFSGGAFPAASALVLRYLQHPAKAADILQDSPAGAAGEGSRRWLFLGVLRHWRFLREGLAAFLRQPPRAALEAILLTAALEIWQTRAEAGRAARVVDGAVSLARQRCSGPEAGLANAVLRRWATRVLGETAAQEQQARRCLLPEWLRERWEARRGRAWLERQLDFLLQPPHTYLQWHGPMTPPESGMEGTEWPGFYRLTGDFPAVRAAVAAGHATIRDPATRLAVDLLLANRRAPARILDLCAAPGGKTRALLAATPPATTVVAVDLPARLPRLQENLLPWGQRVRVQACHLLEEGLPGEHGAAEAVLLDAPCSNTGVLGRKPDIKWRLQPADLQRLPRLQGDLLRAAAHGVSPGGLLVYSTCSLEPEENEAVVRDFLQSPEGSSFRWLAGGTADPVESGHDGAGYFALERTAWK